ncbi:hypothetical protein ACRAWC_21605 [Leifsonia sp. L25]
MKVKMDDYWTNALWSLTPTVLVGLIFWFALRAILRADQRERAAHAHEDKWERSQRGSTAGSELAGKQDPS